MGAFNGRTGNGLKTDFDAAKARRDSLTGYLHCP